MNLTYVFDHGDAVLVTTFLLLAAMSAASWYVMLWKAWMLCMERKALARFRAGYMTAPDWPQRHALGDVEGSIGILAAEALQVAPIAARYAGDDRREVMTTHLAQALDGLRLWLDKGLTLLASIGSSAPFIGLFGTVWGVYNALTAIAAQGNASLGVVAGPMGEALVMTALGLFVAIPAVLGYNAVLRANRVLVQHYRHIAEQLALYAVEHAPPAQKGR